MHSASIEDDPPKRYASALLPKMQPLPTSAVFTAFNALRSCCMCLPGVLRCLRAKRANRGALLRIQFTLIFCRSKRLRVQLLILQREILLHPLAEAPRIVRVLRVEIEISVHSRLILFRHLPWRAQPRKPRIESLVKSPAAPLQLHRCVQLRSARLQEVECKEERLRPHPLVKPRILQRRWWLCWKGVQRLHRHSRPCPPVPAPVRNLRCMPDAHIQRS